MCGFESSGRRSSSEGRVGFGFFSVMLCEVVSLKPIGPGSVARTSSKNKNPAINPMAESADPAKQGRRYGYRLKRGDEPKIEG
jgi:hypothetical protein